MYWTIARSLGVKYEFNKYGKGAWIPNSQNGFNQQFSSFFSFWFLKIIHES